MEFNEAINRFPEAMVQCLKDTQQNPKWHAEGAVFNHIQMVFEYAKEHFPEDPDLQIAALFHDLGKMDSTFKKNDFLVSYGHEHHAKRYLETYGDRFPEIQDESKVYEVCRNHMKMHLVDRMRPFKREELMANRFWDSMVRFAECDNNGRG